MIDLVGMRPRRARTVVWFASGIVALVAVLLLVTGLLVPGFLLDESESSALLDRPTSEPADGQPDELPWAQQHPSPRKLTPDAAVGRLVARFVTQLNAGRAADAVEMLCPDKRRPIHGAVVWTARHEARLRVTTPTKNASRPGYTTIHFAGVIQGHQRRGTIGIDADAKGRPRCVSAFYSVG